MKISRLSGIVLSGMLLVPTGQMVAMDPYTTYKMVQKYKDPEVRAAALQRIKERAAMAKERSWQAVTETKSFIQRYKQQLLQGAGVITAILIAAALATVASRYHDESNQKKQIQSMLPLIERIYQKHDVPFSLSVQNDANKRLQAYGIQILTLQKKPNNAREWLIEWARKIGGFDVYLAMLRDFSNIQGLEQALDELTQYIGRVQR